MKKINWPRIYRISNNDTRLYPRQGLFIRDNKPYGYEYIFILVFPFTGWMSISYLCFRAYEQNTDACTGKKQYKMFFRYGLGSGK